MALTGVANTALWTIMMALTLQFGNDEERPTYVGMANTLVAPVTILAPFFGGWLATIARLPGHISGISDLLSSAILVLHFVVQDPKALRAKRAAQRSRITMLRKNQNAKYPNPAQAWMQKLLAFFFRQLYHRFAWAYDLVAGFVSLGQWNNWIYEILPLISGTKILELGFGPGHLQSRFTRSAIMQLLGWTRATRWRSQTARRLSRAKTGHGLRIVRARAESMFHFNRLF